MKEIREIIKAYAKADKEGKRTALATVVKVEGSSYRRPGARMLTASAATKEGKLLSLAHEVTTHTAINSEFIEPCGDCSKIMYDIPNSLITYKVAPMNIILPTYTRGLGKSTGSFALESAMDELAYQLKIDPPLSSA